MKESLAARQAALLRQNAELDEQVEAIEQRRQQQQQQQQQQQSQGSRPSSSSTAERRSKKRSVETSVAPTSSNDADGGKEPGSGEEDERDGSAPVIPSALARSSSSRSRINMPMDLSASIDSFGAAVRGEVETLNGQPDASKRKAKRANSHNGEAVTEDADANGSSSARGRSQRSASKIDDAEGDEGEGLGLEATVRYQKARLRVLQDEVDSASARIKELESSQATLRSEADAAKAESAALGKKHQQAQQLLDKQRELTAALESKQRILESQLSAAQAQVEEVQRAEKQAAQQFRSKDVRLNRALEELEKVKAQLQEEKRSSGQATVAKDEYDQLLRDNRKLDKQKNELLAAFKKQMKLIDLLKRQRIHMEAAKMLSFTEEEFSKTLELG